MRLGTKIALSITGACLLATILEAALFTRSFARYSRESYFRTKLEEMRSVAKLIDGDYHRSISSQSAVGEPGYARIRAALGEILHADPFATYLYTVNLDTEGRPIYAVDAATVERDTLWLETDDIALEIGRGGSGELELRYDDVMRHPPFPVEPGDARLMIDESRIDGDARVTIAGAELLYWPADGSLPSVAGRTFPPGERTLEFRLEAGGAVLEGLASYSAAGTPSAYPGDPFLDSPAYVAKTKEWLERASAGFYLKPEESIYGSMCSVYAPILDTKAEPAGLVMLDMMDTHRRALSSVVAGTGILTGLGCVAIGFILAIGASCRYARPIRQLSKAAAGLAAGERNVPLPLGREDELGELARSFEDMRRTLAERTAERERLHEESLRTALVDPTTGLPNRRAFLEESATIVALLGRLGSDRALALLYMDLDNFKNINDGYGHGAGDELLRVVGERIRETIRSGDRAFRIGGDEFVILLSSLRREEDVLAVLDKLRAALATPAAVQGREFQAAASFGVALYPRDGTSSEELLRVADAALYEAKRERDSYAFYTADLGERVRRRTEIAELLKAESAFSQFRLVLQPIVSSDGDARAFESLARWRKPDGSEVPPSAFIPIIEEAGLIGAFGSWSLGAAAKASAALPDHLRVAVNLSVIQVLDRGQIDEIEARTRSGELDPGRLYFELTESCFAREREVEPSLRRLADLGYKLSLDDFGSGYSSLGRLGALPFDAFKIDRSLLFAGHDAESRDDILSGIRSLGSGYGVEMVVEGVEEAATAERLAALGFDLFQGYYFSRPLEVEAAARYARERRARAAGLTS